MNMCVLVLIYECVCVCVCVCVRVCPGISASTEGNVCGGGEGGRVLDE